MANVYNEGSLVSSSHGDWDIRRKYAAAVHHSYLLHRFFQCWPNLLAGRIPFWQQNSDRSDYITRSLSHHMFPILLTPFSNSSGVEFHRVWLVLRPFRVPNQQRGSQFIDTQTTQDLHEKDEESMRENWCVKRFVFKHTAGSSLDLSPFATSSWKLRWRGIQMESARLHYGRRVKAAISYPPFVSYRRDIWSLWRGSWDCTVITRSS